MWGVEVWPFPLDCYVAVNTAGTDVLVVIVRNFFETAHLLSARGSALALLVGLETAAAQPLQQHTCIRHSDTAADSISGVWSGYRREVGCRFIYSRRSWILSLPSASVSGAGRFSSDVARRRRRYCTRRKSEVSYAGYSVDTLYDGVGFIYGQRSNGEDSLAEPGRAN